MTEIPGIDPSVPPSGTGCVECDASGGWWVHLRRCAECGHVGCCEASPSQHGELGQRRRRSRGPATGFWWLCNGITLSHLNRPVLGMLIG